LFSGEVETRTSDVKDNLDTRRMYRRTRRGNHRKNNKCKFKVAKFKHPIWKNRRKHKFQPTHWHLINSHSNLLGWIFDRVPLDQSKLHIEYNKFDIQKMINPNIRNWQYAKGMKYGFENTKLYVRNRDNYQCQICKQYVSNTVNHVHHIVWKSNGGSDSPLNLILLCSECHKKVHACKIVCPTKSGSVNKYRDAGVLNSCMKHIFASYEDIIPTQDTYGYITNAVRKQWGLEKTHANDASVIAICDSNGFMEELRQYTQWSDEDVTINFKQYRRHVRNWVQRHEDRKYYIDDFKNPRKVFAWNRNRRSGQAKDKCCLTELKQKLISKNVLHKVKIIAKPGRTIYRKSHNDMLFKPGDIIQCPKGVDVVKSWATTQRRIVTEHLGEIKQRYCTKILNNSGMCVI